MGTAMMRDSELCAEALAKVQEGTNAIAKIASRESDILWQQNMDTSAAAKNHQREISAITGYDGKLQGLEKKLGQ